MTCHKYLYLFDRPTEDTAISVLCLPVASPVAAPVLLLLLLLPKPEHGGPSRDGRISPPMVRHVGPVSPWRGAHCSMPSGRDSSGSPTPCSVLLWVFDRGHGGQTVWSACPVREFAVIAITITIPIPIPSRRVSVDHAFSDG